MSLKGIGRGVTTFFEDAEAFQKEAASLVRFCKEPQAEKDIEVSALNRFLELIEKVYNIRKKVDFSNLSAINPETWKTLRQIDVSTKEALQALELFNSKKEQIHSTEETKRDSFLFNPEQIMRARSSIQQAVAILKTLESDQAVGLQKPLVSSILDHLHLNASEDKENIKETLSIEVNAELLKPTSYEEICDFDALEESFSYIDQCLLEEKKLNIQCTQAIFVAFVFTAYVIRTMKVSYEEAYAYTRCRFPTFEEFNMHQECALQEYSRTFATKTD